MAFITDKQTLDDLNVLGKYKSNSIYNLFNKVRTTGGGKLLDNMFHHPLTDPGEINKRSTIFSYFQQNAIEFPFSTGQFSAMENYLNAEGGGNFMVVAINTFRRKILNYIGLDQEYNLIHKGVSATIEVLNKFRDFINRLHEMDPGNPYQERIYAVNEVFLQKRLSWLSRETTGESLLLFRMIRYDYLLRHAMQEQLKAICQIIYHIDVCVAVAGVARLKNFSYASALPAERNVIHVTDFRHPALDKAVANSLSLHQDSNVLFLTGANMAGKSTFMKSFGIAVYLAHMGFPVAAKAMEFSVKDGIYSSINVPDNLSMGYSHFYAEVLRVKKVAEEVSRSKNLIVIFDELFKGTNVKDAYDATLAVTEAFSENRNCSFIISTHIIEVGQTLRDRCDNLQFVYFPTIMEELMPVYTYKLQPGITTDRHGMMIIENERILEIIGQE